VWGVQATAGGYTVSRHVLDERPESTGCHRYKIAPGESFEVVAGGIGTDEADCKHTSANGAPIGPESEFVIGVCRPRGQLGSECNTSYSACRGDSSFGMVDFALLAPIPEGEPTTGQFVVQEAPPHNCPEILACTDRYSVRVERIVE
jgi:hypothetical protein